MILIVNLALIWNSTLPPGPIMYSDWFRFQTFSCQKMQKCIELLFWSLIISQHCTQELSLLIFWFKFNMVPNYFPTGNRPVTSGNLQKLELTQFQNQRHLILLLITSCCNCMAAKYFLNERSESLLGYLSKLKLSYYLL